MLKDRQEGLVCIHAIALALIALLSFIGWAALVEGMGWIRFVQQVNFSLYLIGIGGGMFWIYHGLHVQRYRLGNMRWLDALRLSRHQLVRLVIVLFSLAFVTKDIDVSRAFLVGYLGVVGTLFFLANTFLPRLFAGFLFRDTVMRTVMIAPSGELREMQEWLESRQHLGLKLVGYLSDAEDTDHSGPMRIGRVAELRRVIQEYGIAQVVISQLRFSPEECSYLARCAEELGCRVRFFVNIQRYFHNHAVSIEHDADYTFVTLTAEPLDNPLNRVMKRLLDISIALPVVCLVMPPLTLLVWAFQRVQSPGPIFHRQVRSGLNRKKFLIWKYRSMHVQKDPKVESVQAKRGDSRVFAFGRFLRRSSLDEIPQFLNVLFGDMSVSGPRPHLLEHDAEFSKVVGSYYVRHFVKPGITGLAQSQGFRGEISETALLQKRISYDMLYVSRWSLMLDLQILIRTVRQVFFPPRSAY